MKTYTVMEDGTCMDINDTQLKILTDADIVYRCEDCNGMYHISNDKSWDDVDITIGIQPPPFVKESDTAE